LEYLVLERDYAGSVYNHVRRSRENARAVQDHIPKEVWQTLNDFYHFIREPKFEQQFETEDPVTTIDTLLRHALYLAERLKHHDA
jgi:uncharacterized alpha-E superfamily protein